MAEMEEPCLGFGAAALLVLGGELLDLGEQLVV
jgi:hypothetical protein